MVASPSPRTTARSGVPAFALYGEAGQAGADLLHLESIASRSQRYRWEIDAHLHPGLHQLLWLEAGRAEVWLDTRRQVCDGPALIVLPAGVVHAFRFSPESQGCVLTLDPRALIEGDAQSAGPAMRALFDAPQVMALAGADAGTGTGADAHADPSAAGETARLAMWFELLSAEFAVPRPATAPVCLWLARALVWHTAELAARRDAGTGPVRAEHRALFTRFLELVELRHASHWPVSRYASRLGLSAERLNRLVRAQSGRSALELVHERLAREACRRLTYVAAPVSQLAYELGFEDPAYFCRFFKRRVGCSPREYRRRGLEA